MAAQEASNAPAVAEASDDDDVTLSQPLPMKRVFITEVDTHLGQRVAARFGQTGEYRVVGTLRHDPVRDDMSPEEAEAATKRPLPPYVAEAVPGYLNDNVAFKKYVLDADVVVCVMRDSAVEAWAATRMLRNEMFNVEKTLVVISTALTWADTLKAEKAEADAQKEAARLAAIAAGEEVEEEEEEVGIDEEPEEIPPFTEDQYLRRVPAPRYQSFRDVEREAKAANSETLHTYVFFAGLMYGGGEDMLEPFFRRAWHQQALPMYTDGTNVVPMIHVDDLATAAFKAGTYLDVLPQRYIFGVDRGNHTWGQVVQAVTSSLGNGETYPEARTGNVADAPWMTADIRAEGGAIFELVEESEFIAADGFVASIGKVIDEYKATRSLTPVRVAVLGPPLSGKTTLCNKLAAEYRLRRLGIPEIVTTYEARRSELQHQIRELRRQRLRERRAAAKAEADRIRKEEEEEERERRAAEEGDDGDGEAEDSDTAGRTPTPGENERGPDEASDFDVSFEIDAPEKDEDEEAAGEADPQHSTNDEGFGDEGEEGDAASVGPLGPEDVDLSPQDDEDDEQLNKLKEDLEYVTRVLSLKPKGGRYIDEALAVMARRALREPLSAAQGYILDGFPKTVRQAAATFGVNDPTLPEHDEDGELPPPEELDAGTLTAPADAALLLDSVIVTTAAEECLIERSVSDDTAGKNAHKSLANTYRRLAVYRANNPTAGKPHESVEGWFSAILTATEAEGVQPRGVGTLVVDMTSKAVPNPDAVDRAYAAVHKPLPPRVVPTAPLPGGAALGASASRHRDPSAGEESNPAAGDDDNDGTAQANGGSDSAPAEATEGEVLDHALRSITAFLGAPHFLRPTPEEIVRGQADAAEKVELTRLREIRETEERARQEAAVASDAARVAHVDQRRLLSVNEERALAAEHVTRLTMDQYLSTYLLPAIADGVTHVCKLRPDDPVDTLANFLFEYQPKSAVEPVSNPSLLKLS